MRKAFFLLLLFLMATGSALAQFTTVTGTVIDPNGIPYANGTITATLNTTASPTLNGFSYQPPTQPVGLNSAGVFLMQLGDNAILLPGGTTWTFKVCSAAGTVQPAGGKGPVCFIVSSLVITGASQDISVQLQAAALALTFGGGGTVPTDVTGKWLNSQGIGTPAVFQTKALVDIRDKTSCGAVDDTAALTTLLGAIGSANAGIWLSCPIKLSNITIPANVLLDPSSSGSINVVTGQTVTIQGPIVPVARKIFFNATVTSGAPTFTPVASDNFTRANENPLSNGGNWVGSTGIPQLQLTGNTVEATTIASALNESVWTGNAFNNNQYSTVTISTLTTSSEGVGPIVRASTAANTHYYARLLGPLSSPTLTLGKIVAGANTFLNGPFAVTFTSGNTLTIGVENSTLYAYINGVLVGTAVDGGASIASGSPGIRYQVSALANAQSTAWAGGNFTSGFTQGTISFSGNKVVREFYPEWWGAVKDGATNDLTALQATSDAVDTAGGGTIHLGAGNYNIGAGEWLIGSGNATHSINVMGAGLNVTKIVSVNPTLNAIYLQREKYSHLQDFGLNQTGVAQTGIGIAMGGDAAGGTQTNGDLMENISVNNFNWGISGSGGNGTSSEITFANVILSNNVNGFRVADSNGLNYTFINLQISSNTIGVNATTSGINVYGGAASANGDDFVFGGNNMRNITAFRSETVVNTCVTLNSGDLAIINLRCSGLLNADSHTAINFSGGRLGVRESWIEGQVLVNTQLRQTDGNEITIEDSTIFDGNNTYSYTSQPVGMGPGFRFSSGLNSGGRFSSRNNFHYGAGLVNLGQWPGGEGYIMSPQGSNQTAAYLIEKSIGGVLTPGAGGAPANTIGPSAYIHHIGAGLIKTIDASGGVNGFNGGVLPFRCFQAIADAAYTTDTTGNVSVALTAVVGQAIEWCYDLVATKWYPAGTNSAQLEGATWEVPGTIGSTTPNAGAFTTLTGTSFKTTTNCSATGSAANPSIVACGSAAAGAFSCDPAATGGTCQVNTTAVTANSRILVQQSDAEGANLGVTCNTAITISATSPLLASKSAGANFVINLGTVTTNPACFVFWIVN